MAPSVSRSFLLDVREIHTYFPGMWLNWDDKSGACRQPRYR